MSLLIMKETNPQVPSLIFSSAFQEHGVMTAFHAIHKQRLKMSSVLYFVKKNPAFLQVENVLLVFALSARIRKIVT